ncbi:hypothetical protein ABZT43_44015 [Streptomyces sp. NPDC005349]|uniref:hypothetical protein n=1 Tax=Streptomyces sp. NPDC005349 TaxID=3157037 RepID=UPI0033B1D4D5
MTTGQAVDSGRKEEFAGRMVQVVNDACLGYLCSLGHRTGLFDTMAPLPPSTSVQIAKAADLVDLLSKSFAQFWATVNPGRVDRNFRSQG